MTREEAIEVIEQDIPCEHDRDLIEALDMAISALSADARPNIHGHWKALSDGYGDNAYICECSECKDTVWVYKDADRKWNFCPNCGADMRGNTKCKRTPKEGNNESYNSYNCVNWIP